MNPTAPKPMPSQVRLLHLLKYDPDTGHLYWREPQLKKALRGKRVGWQMNDGYIHLEIPEGKFLAHRLIWVMITGAPPKDDQTIDHTNRVRHDNSWRNLRLISDQENRWNRKQRAGSSMPYVGVRTVGRRFGSRISINGKMKHLGLFATAEEAARAFDNSVRQIRGPLAPTNKSLGLL